MKTVTTTLAAAAVLATLAGCAATGPGGTVGPAADAPTVKVGDRWVYRGKDGYRVAIVWDETHEITGVGPEGITVRVTGKGPTIDFQRAEAWSAPGIVRSGAVFESETDRFDPALIRYKYPLTTGETWNQAVRDLNKPAGPYGSIQRRVTVAGYESVSTPAGKFSAIKLQIFMRLDDETFWRFPTECNYLVWYAPAVGAMVRAEQRSQYRERGGMSSFTVPGQYATLELVSYTHGAR